MVFLAIASIFFIPIVIESDITIWDALKNKDISKTILFYSALLSILFLVFGFSFVLADLIMFLWKKASILLDFLKNQTIKLLENIMRILKTLLKKLKLRRNKGRVPQKPKKSVLSQSTENTVIDNNSKCFALVLTVLIPLAICLLGSYILGYIVARDTEESKIYKIIELEQAEPDKQGVREAKVVIYEGSDFLILCNCTITENDTTSIIQIDKSIQTKIEKNDVQIVLKEFSEVDK